MKILVIAPHFDDEIIGCGGFIAKSISEQNEVFVCYVTEGKNFTGCTNKRRKFEKEQALKICKLMGIKKAFFLDFPAVNTDQISFFKICEKLSKCVDLVKPDIILTPDGGDANKDHKITYEATLVASRPFIRSFIKKVYTYETLSSTEWNYSNSFKPNTFVDISNFLDIKKEVLEKYEIALRDFPHPRSLKAIEALAVYRGACVGKKAAEAFRLVRDII